MQSYSTHLRPKSPRKIIIRVLEKYVRLVAVTCTSPKVGVAASKLVPRKEKIGSKGLKEFLKELITLSYCWLVLLVSNIFFVFFCIFWLRGRMLG